MSPVVAAQVRTQSPHPRHRIARGFRVHASVTDAIDVQKVGRITGSKTEETASLSHANFGGVLNSLKMTAIRVVVV